MKKVSIFVLLLFVIILSALSCDKKVDVVVIDNISDIVTKEILETNDSIMQDVPKFLYYINGMNQDDIDIKQDCSKDINLEAPNILIYNCNKTLTRDTNYTYTAKLSNLKAGVKYTLEISKDLMNQIYLVPNVMVRKADAQHIVDNGTGESTYEDFDDSKIAEMKELLINHGVPESEISGFTTSEDINQYIQTNYSDIQTPNDDNSILYKELLDITMTSLPQGAIPSVVAYTFTPSEDGDYIATISFNTDILDYKTDSSTGELMPNEEASIEESLKNLSEFFLIRFYEELGVNEDEYGTPYRVSYHTPSDLINLRQIYAEGLSSAYEVEEGKSEAIPYVELKYENLIFIKAPEDMLSSVAAKQNNVEPDLIKEIILQTKSRISDKIQENINRNVTSDSKTSKIDTEITIKMSDKNDRVGDLHLGSAHDAKIGFHRTDAMNTFQIREVPQKPISKVDIKFINSEQSLEDEMSNSIGASLGLDSISIKNTTKMREKTKLGLNTTTLLIRYEHVDSQYNTLSYDELNNYIRPAALETFRKDPNLFIKEHGDYFVSGYRYGAKFEALLTITASSYEKISSIENALNIKLGKVELDDKFQQKLTEALKDTKTSLTMTIMGANKDGSGDFNPTDYNSLIQKLNEFMRAAENADKFRYVPIYAKLLRYRALNSFSSLPANINIPTELLKQSRAFVRAYNRMTSYYNSATDIPKNNLYDANQTLAKWQETFNNYKTKVDSQFEEILSSVENINKELDELNSVSDYFRKISERWSFYQKLMAEQENDKKGFQDRPNTKSPENNHAKSGTDYLEGDYKDNSNWKQGIKSFDISKDVTEHLGSCSSDTKNEDWHFARRNYWTIEKSLSPNEVVRYWYIWSGSNWDEIRQRNRAHIGRSAYKWDFQSGLTREAHWKYEICTVRLDTDTWPFTGLEK